MVKPNVQRQARRGGKILSLILFLLVGFGGVSLAANCTQWAGGTIASGSSVYGYSTVLWTITGQNYPSTCASFSGLLTCNNGTILGNYSFYKYTAGQCNAGVPKTCQLPWGATLAHGASITGYSSTGIMYPGTCDQIATTLKCVNGNLNGNRQTYTAASCTQGDPLFNGTDLEILPTFSGLPSGGTGIAKMSSPVITLALRNNGTTLINTTAGPGFVFCTWDSQGIYTSPALGSIVINPGTKIGLPIQLQSIFTQSLGEKTVTCTVNLSGDMQPFNNTRTKTFSVIDAKRFDLAMEQSITSIKANLEAGEGAVGVQGLKNFVFSKLMNFLVPMVVIIGILVALIGFYKLMFSSDEKAVSEGTKYIIYGALGIIVIMSAKFIGANIYTILTPTSGDIEGYKVAQALYDKIFFPFIKIAIYLVLGAMFVILVSRVISFVFGKDEDTKKKAGTIIGRNVLGMLVIIGAKQIVEAVYGKQSQVVKPISNLGEIGTGILADKNIPLVYQVVNRVLGLTALILLVLIIVQTIQLLVNPNDEKQMGKVKNSILYMAAGFFIIGAGYLVVNFLIVN